MGKFTAIVDRYTALGVSSSNIEFAIDAVKNGTKREHILESLTADYRGMQRLQANTMLEELFVANGGEFKKENQGGYLFGALFLLIGLGCFFYIYSSYTNNQPLIRPILTWAAAIGGTFSGLAYVIAALLGKFREGHEPFKD